MSEWPPLIGVDIGSGLVKGVMSVQAGLKSFVFPARVRAGFLGPDYSVETEGVYPFRDFSVTVGGFPAESGVPSCEVIKSLSDAEAKGLFVGHVFSRFRAQSPMRFALVGEGFSEADIKLISELDEVVSPGFSLTVVGSVHAAIGDIGLDRYGRSVLGSERLFSEPVLVIDGGRNGVRCWVAEPGVNVDGGRRVNLVGSSDGGLELEREIMRRSVADGSSASYGAIECLWLRKLFVKSGWRSCSTLAEAVLEIGREMFVPRVRDWVGSNGAKTVVVVGGMAPVISAAIGRVFGSSLRVFVPESPEVALARGGAKLIRSDFQVERRKLGLDRGRRRDKQVRISVARRVISDDLFEHLSSVDPLALGFEVARLASIGLKAEMDRGVRVERPDVDRGLGDERAAAWRRIEWRRFADRW